MRHRRNLAEAERLALAEIVGRETVVERDERLSLMVFGIEVLGFGELLGNSRIFPVLAT